MGYYETKIDEAVGSASDAAKAAASMAGQVVSIATSAAQAAVQDGIGDAVADELGDTGSAAHAALVSAAGTISDPTIAAQVSAPASLTAAALNSTFAAKGGQSRSLADFGVLPGNTAAQNRTGFTAAAASGLVDFTLPPGTYQWSAATQGAWMMSFTGAESIRIRGLGAVINDTTAYTNAGAFTGLFLLDGCKDFAVSGIEYVGPVLASPTTDLGYRGAFLVRAINGTDGVAIDMRARNVRYGVQTGDYSDGSKGNCKNFSIALRGSMIGYPLAAYYANGIRFDVDVDGVHRAAYIAGCDDVRGVARWRDQYIADTVVILSDALTAGSDAAAEADPVGAPTTSRGCTNIDVTSIDKGSATYQASSMCAGIGLSRADPVEYKNIKVKVSTRGTDTNSVTVGGFRVVSGVKSLYPRYAWNWHSGIILDQISVSGTVDQSARTTTAPTSAALNFVTYDTDATHAATVRGVRVDGLTHLPAPNGSVANQNDFSAPGLTTPATISGLNAPGVDLNIFTNATYETVLDNCKVATLRPGSVTGGSKITLGLGTVVAAHVSAGTILNTILNGGSVGGAGVVVKQREFPRSLSGASASWAGLPAGSIVLGVQGRIQTAITGATGFQVGVAGDLTRYADVNATAVGATFGPANAATTEVSPRLYPSLGTLVVTAKGGSFTTGTIRLIVTLMEFSAPA